MKAILKPGALAGIFGALFLCSCVTTRPPLPPDLTMNPQAGRGDPGDWLIVMVRINGGEPLPFIVDTGAPMTCLDQSLEPRLGKRLANATYVNMGASHPGGVYRAPKFFVGTIPLRDSGAYVETVDCTLWSRAAGVPFRGFLGMDVLKHYCVQMDFQNGRVRFLDEQHADKSAWGTRYHLRNVGDGCVFIADNFTGVKGRPSMIDTGSDSDGFLVPQLYRQWTNQAAPPAPGRARFPDGALGGDIYHDLDLSCMPASDHDAHSRFNLIGIHSLSENLVTFDFPERTMYLKRVSDWPLADRDIEAAALAVDQSAADVLENLKRHGRLPGWTGSDTAAKAVAHFRHGKGLDLVTFDVRKTGGTSLYHFTFSRVLPAGAWALQKAWLTGPDGRTIEEFPPGI